MYRPAGAGTPPSLPGCGPALPVHTRPLQLHRYEKTWWAAIDLGSILTLRPGGPPGIRTRRPKLSKMRTYRSSVARPLGGSKAVTLQGWDEELVIRTLNGTGEPP